EYNSILRLTALGKRRGPPRPSQPPWLGNCVNERQSSDRSRTTRNEMKTTYLSLIPSSFYASLRIVRSATSLIETSRFTFAAFFVSSITRRKPFSGTLPSLIESLCDAVISGCSKFPVYLLPLDQKLNGPFWVCSEESSGRAPWPSSD